MNKKMIGIFVLIVLLLAATLGTAYFINNKHEIDDASEAKTQTAAVQESKPEQIESDAPISSALQEELNTLSSQLVSDLQSENRLNLNLLGQLRSYQQMLAHIQTYAKEVEKEIEVIEEISKDEFQEDVKLQASLFAGKQPELVAKHLEEFRASRVGAILAKMKEKEASAVLDIWAKKKDPRASIFYREAMSAYLNNRRRDIHPELFDKSKKEPEKAVAQRAN